MNRNCKQYLSVTLSRLVVMALFAGLMACSSPTERANTYYQKGSELLKKGDLAKAELEFKNALQIKKSMVPALYGLAMVAEKQANWQRMFGLLSTVVELDPKHLEAQVKLGRLLLAAGQLDKALEVSNLTLNLNKEDVAVLTLRAAVLLKLDDKQGAIDNAKQALAKDPNYIDALVVLATERLSAGDSAKAIEYLDAGLKQNDKNIALQLIKIQALNSLSKLDKAEEVFRKLITYYPDTKELRYALGQLYLNQGRKDEAEAEFRSVVAQKPDDLQAKLDLVRFLSFVRDKQTARQQLEAYAQKEPENYPLKFALANFYQSQNDSKAAEKVYREIIQKEGDSKDGVNAKGMLAVALMTGGDKPAAEKLVNEILATDKRNEQALLLKAGIDITNQKLDEAIAGLRTILRDVPDSSRALLLLARAHEKAGSPELAEEHYLRAFQASKKSAAYGTEYVQFLMKRNQTQRAEKILEEVLAAAPGQLPVLKMLAQVRLSLSDWAGAQTVADEIRKLGDQEHLFDQIAGVIFAGKKNYAESISAFKRAYESAPSEMQPIVALVRTYLLAGKNKEAASFLDSVLKANPSNVNARLMQGQLHAMGGEKQKAAESFNAAIAQSPKSAGGYLHLASFYLRTKQLAEAEKVINDGLAAVPGDMMLRTSKAGLYEMSGRNEDAIKLYEELIKERPDAEILVNNLASLLSERTDKASLDRAYELAQRLKHTDIPQFKDTFGWANYKVGKFDDATISIGSATEKLPGLPILHYHLGMSYLGKLDKVKARKELEKALELAKGTPFDKTAEIQKVLKDLGSGAP